MCILFGIFLAKSLGESTLTGLLVERRKIMTRLAHHLHHFIKRHTVMTVGERGIQVGIQGSGCSKGITLDNFAKLPEVPSNSMAMDERMERLQRIADLNKQE